jgi:hypothetical protein
MLVRILVDHVEHDGRRLPCGASVEMPDAQAAQLIEAACAEPAAPPQDDPTADAQPARRRR